MLHLAADWLDVSMNELLCSTSSNAQGCEPPSPGVDEILICSDSCFLVQAIDVFFSLKCIKSISQSQALPLKIK